MIRMTDSFTDELFACEGIPACKIVFPVSRLVVDPERFVDDIDEPMSTKGMGVVYTKTSGGDNLRQNLSSEERTSLINNYYEPHHKKLNNVVGNMLMSYRACLIIDCHSFPSSPLPCELDQSANRPDICLGTDEFHTPTWMSELAGALFQKNGFQVELNRPFSGTLVPKPYYHIEVGCQK